MEKITFWVGTLVLACSVGVLFGYLFTDHNEGKYLYPITYEHVLHFNVVYFMIAGALIWATQAGAWFLAGKITRD